MNVIMSPLWAVDLVLILAPVAMAIAVAVRRMQRGEPVEAMLVSAAVAFAVFLFRQVKDVELKRAIGQKLG